MIEEVERLATVADSFADWLFSILRIQASLTIGKICIILRNLWRHKNNKLWRNEDLLPAHLVCLSMNYFRDWFDTNGDINSSKSSSCNILQPLERWIMPPPCVLKCNTDASIFQGQCKTCIRLVIRDSMGDFFACARIHQVREAEAITQWEALSRIKGK